MGDIKPHNTTDLIHSKSELYTMHLNILLNDKLNQLKQQDVLLDHLRTVKIKEIEFKKSTLQEEIKELRREIQEKSVINVKEVK